MGFDGPPISNADWVIIGIGLATLAATVVGVVIAWKMLRQPATTITPGFFRLARLRSKDANGLLQASGQIDFTPMGTSFVIVDVRCRLSAGGEAVDLAQMQAPVGQVFQGGHSLRFVFQESDPRSAFPDDPGLCVDLDLWIKLNDKSVLHERQKRLATRDQIVSVAALINEPTFGKPTIIQHEPTWMQRFKSWLRQVRSE